MSKLIQYIACESENCKNKAACAYHVSNGKKVITPKISIGKNQIGDYYLKCGSYDKKRI